MCRVVSSAGLAVAPLAIAYLFFLYEKGCCYAVSKTLLLIL
jgi:hypothetical protein